MFDRKFLNSNMKNGDYTFLMYYYDLASKLEELLDGVDITDPKVVEDLAYYYTKIDEVIKLVKSVKKDMQKKKVRNFLEVGLSCGLVSLVGNAILTTFAGCGFIAGCVATFFKYHEEIKNINALLKRLDESSDELQKYATEISEYEINFAKKKPNLSVSYADMLALIGTLDNDLKKEYLKRLKKIYGQNKDNAWNLALAVKSLKEEIRMVEHQNYVDEDFVVTNLLEHLKNANTLDLELIKEITYYISSRGVSDKDRYYKEFALACCDNIKRRLFDLQKNGAECDVKSFLANELAILPQNVKNLIMRTLEETLANDEKFQNLKQKQELASLDFMFKEGKEAVDFDKYLIEAMDIYMNDVYKRKMDLPKN